MILNLEREKKGNSKEGERAKFFFFQSKDGVDQKLLDNYYVYNSFKKKVNSITGKQKPKIFFSESETRQFFKINPSDINLGSPESAVKLKCWFKPPGFISHIMLLKNPQDEDCKKKPNEIIVYGLKAPKEKDESKDFFFWGISFLREKSYKKRCRWCDKKHKKKLNRCSNCKMAFYCGKECQMKHYNQHKKYCNEYARYFMD